MLKVGITGGIGSGKSIVSRLFQMLGTPVYNADDAAKAIMNSSEKVRREIIKNFGEATYINGVLNRPVLAALVFNDQAKLQVLNSIVHPAVISDANTWMQQQKTAVVMKEAAIFFESGSYKEMDLMIGVYAPKLLRMERAMGRDNATEAAIEERMSRQMNEEEKMKRCDFVVQNDEQQLVIPQVLAIYKQLLAIAIHKSD